MKKETIPVAISDYVNKRFRDDFLFDIKKVRTADGHWLYDVRVSKDNYIHKLKFTEEGTLMKEHAEQAFPADIHELEGYEEMPE